MEIHHVKSVILGLIGGHLLFIGGIIGSIGLYGLIIELITPHVPVEGLAYLEIALLVLNYLASIGGISVIIGTILIGLNRERFGKFVMGIGLGTTLISFIIKNVSMAVQGVLTQELLLTLVQTPEWIGTILILIIPFVLKVD